MARLFCIPGAALLFAAFVLNCIVSVSLPYLPHLDVTRTYFESGALRNGQTSMSELRFGIWAPCSYNTAGDSTCTKQGYAYNVTVTEDPDSSKQVTITSSWTRGLAVHPVATVATLLATTLALSENVTVALVAALTGWTASLLTLVAFIIDLVLYGWTKHQFKQINLEARTVTAPGLWITLIAFAILLFGSLSVCLGRVKDRRAKRATAGPAAVETAHAKEASAATAVADEKAEKELERIKSNTSAESHPAKGGWADKFKFGKKAQA